MKRLVICYDGTWNALTNPDEVTNVVRVAQAIKSVADDGTVPGRLLQRRRGQRRPHRPSSWAAYSASACATT